MGGIDFKVAKHLPVPGDDSNVAIGDVELDRFATVRPTNGDVQQLGFVAARSVSRVESGAYASGAELLVTTLDGIFVCHGSARHR